MVYSQPLHDRQNMTLTLGQFMGIGNLICMPLALSVGRRAIYLASLLVCLLGGLLAAYAPTYEWHLGARMVLGLAAGNSEALVPMMIQEIHFVHERSTFLMWQSAMQISITAVYTMFASPIAGAIGPSNWYILGTGLAMVVFLLSIFFVPESRYPRSLAAYGQEPEDEVAGTAQGTMLRPMRISERPALDFQTYPARTLWSDMRLFVGKPDWTEGAYALRVSTLDHLNIISADGSIRTLFRSCASPTSSGHSASTASR